MTENKSHKRITGAMCLAMETVNSSFKDNTSKFFSVNVLRGDENQWYKPLIKLNLSNKQTNKHYFYCNM